MQVFSEEAASWPVSDEVAELILPVLQQEKKLVWWGWTQEQEQFREQVPCGGVVLLTVLPETEWLPILSEAELLSAPLETELLTALPEAELLPVLSEPDLPSVLPETEVMSAPLETEVLSVPPEAEDAAVSEEPPVQVWKRPLVQGNLHSSPRRYQEYHQYPQ